MTQQSHTWVLSIKNKNTDLKIYTEPKVHSSTTFSSQDMEATLLPINR